MKNVEHHETPDIEVDADRWEEEQEVLLELAEDDGLEDARGISECEAHIANREYDKYAGINSCDALRIIDGVV